MMTRRTTTTLNAAWISGVISCESKSDSFPRFLWPRPRPFVSEKRCRRNPFRAHMNGIIANQSEAESFIRQLSKSREDSPAGAATSYSGGRVETNRYS